MEERVLVKTGVESWRGLLTSKYRCRRCGTVWVFHHYDAVEYPRPYSEPWDGKGCPACIEEARRRLYYRH